MSRDQKEQNQFWNFRVHVEINMNLFQFYIFDNLCILNRSEHQETNDQGEDDSMEKDAPESRTGSIGSATEDGVGNTVNKGRREESEEETRDDRDPPLLGVGDVITLNLI